LPVEAGLPNRFPSRWFHLRHGYGGQAGEAALHLYWIKQQKSTKAPFLGCLALCGFVALCEKQLASSNGPVRFPARNPG
jgi:hypothetical protein